MTLCSERVTRRVKAKQFLKRANINEQIIQTVYSHDFSITISQ